MDASPFALLSPELRNIIWEYTTTSSYAITFSNKAIFPPLTSTCRQIRSETLEMYLSLTIFNAHLDDGPVQPLLAWLTAIGPKQCLLLHELNVWDLHMLNITLLGSQASAQALKEGSTDGKPYLLRSVNLEVFYRNRWLDELVLVLQTMDLELARLCVIGSNERFVRETSRFAIVPSAELDRIDLEFELQREGSKLDVFGDRVC